MAGKYNLNIKRFFNHKGKKKYFTNYIFVIFCLFAFTLSAFFITMNSLKTVFDNNNRLIVNTVTMSLNEVFKKVDNVYKTLENSSVGANLFEYGTLEEYMVMEETDVAEITKSIIIYDFIEEVVFISKDRDYLITSRGAYGKKELFNDIYNSEEYGYVFFDNIITDYMNVKVIPATSYKNKTKYPAEDPKELFAFVKTQNEKGMNIIIFVSEDKFTKAANLNTIENNININVYDYNNSVVYSNNNRNYLINTKNISKDFQEQVINSGLKKYYVIKSSYNYFYYVAEINDYILIFSLTGIIIMLLGLVVSFYYLMKKTNLITDEIEPVYEELQLNSADSGVREITDEIKKYKNEISESKNKVDTMSDEIKNSTFLKLINSSSFYTRNRKTVDLVFEKIANKQRFFILSAETIKENNRLPHFDIESITGWLVKNGVEFVQIEEKTRKNLFVSVIPDVTDIKELVKKLEPVLDDIRKNGLELLVCLSKEFKEISNLYDAYRDIKICRDYRGVSDKNSILDVESLAYGSHIFLPINFKEELTGKIMAQEEENAKEYVKEIFDVNIKNNIPLSKFEFMLRQMLSIVTEALSISKKSTADLYELEQVFLLGIDNLKDNFDVNGIINSFMNLLHLTVSMFDTKKTTLNRTAVIKYINNFYAEDLYLEKIATEFGTTPKYFSNYFKKEFMIGFNEYLTQVRISHAKQILSETELSLSAVSNKVGYSNQTTFAVAFKKMVGIPPGKYREMNKS